jgi:hypothetical protein
MVIVVIFVSVGLAVSARYPEANHAGRGHRRRRQLPGRGSGLLEMPKWLISLSVFHQYGQPLADQGNAKITSCHLR